MARRVATRISLEGVQEVVAGFKRAGDAAKGFGDSVQQSVGKGLDYVNKHSQTIDQLGRGFSIAGALAAAGLGAVTKAAMDWESAWTGVEKTVDGTAAEMATLEGSLRELARTMPTTHRDIAAVAEAAGQLGIKRDSIAQFTKTMIQLGETTNLSAEEAASSLAQLMNVMGTSTKDVGRLGAAIVALGNDGASTERDIVMLAQRLAGTGNLMRMSEADVLAYANAMASVGIEAEAGGTAMSMTWKDIDKAVREGGRSLETIARVSGMTAQEFARSWGQDAAGASATFIEGLGRMQGAGEDVNGVLGELGMTGMRQGDTLLRLAGATEAAGAANDLLRDSLELGKQAWSDNSALAEEYAKRADDAAQQAQVAWNNIKDAAISTGQQMLPVVADIANGVAEVARWFGEMPEGVQEFSLGMMGVVAAGGLGVGALTKMITTVAELKVGLESMGWSARGAGLAMGAIGIALTVAGLALGSWISKQAEARALADQLASAIKEQGAVMGELTRQIAAQRLEQDGALVAAQLLGLELGTVTDAALGNAEAMAEVADAISAARDANVDFGDGMNDYLNAANDLESSLGLLNKATVEGAASATRWAEASRDSADASDEDSAAKQRQSQALAEQERALQQSISATQQLGNALLALSGSETGVAAAIQSATKAAQENGRTLDLNTEAGLRNRQALDNLASAGMRQIAVMAENEASTEELTAKSAYLTEQFVATAEQMGMNADEARALAEQYFAVPTDINTHFGTTYDPTGVNQALKGLANIPRHTYAYVHTVNVGPGPQVFDGMATGGPVFGPGTGTSDSILARLSNGEHVWTAAEVAALGGHDAVMRLRKLALSHSVPGFAEGGAVLASPRPAPVGTSWAQSITNGGDTYEIHVTVPAKDLVEVREIADWGRSLRVKARMQGVPA